MVGCVQGVGGNNNFELNLEDCNRIGGDYLFAFFGKVQRGV